MQRHELEEMVDALRAEHPDRDEFIAAVTAFSRTLDERDRDLLGQVLVQRQPDTGGFDVLTERLEAGGWFQRTMRKIEKRNPQR